jgi:hypothetical protein
LLRWPPIININNNSKSKHRLLRTSTTWEVKAATKAMVEVRVATVGVEVGRGMVGVAIVVVTVGGIVVVVGTVTMGTVVVIRVVVAVVGTVGMTGASRIILEVA